MNNKNKWEKRERTTIATIGNSLNSNQFFQLNRTCAWADVRKEMSEQKKNNNRISATDVHAFFFVHPIPIPVYDLNRVDPLKMDAKKRIFSFTIVRRVVSVILLVLVLLLRFPRDYCCLLNICCNFFFCRCLAFVISFFSVLLFFSSRMKRTSHSCGIPKKTIAKFPRTHTYSQ